MLEAMGVMFFLFLVLAGALMCGFLGAVVAARNDAPGLGFLMGLLFGPIGVIVAFALDGRPKCAKCAGRLDPNATVCQHCGHEWGAKPAKRREHQEAIAAQHRRHDEARSAKCQDRRDARREKWQSVAAKWHGFGSESKFLLVFWFAIVWVAVLVFGGTYLWM